MKRKFSCTFAALLIYGLFLLIAETRTRAARRLLIKWEQIDASVHSPPSISPYPSSEARRGNNQ